MGMGAARRYWALHLMIWGEGEEVRLPVHARQPPLLPLHFLLPSLLLRLLLGAAPGQPPLPSLLLLLRLQAQHLRLRCQAAAREAESGWGGMEGASERY